MPERYVLRSSAIGQMKELEIDPKQSFASFRMVSCSNELVRVYGIKPSFTLLRCHQQSQIPFSLPRAPDHPFHKSSRPNDSVD